jgi:hypothetical protein
VIVLKIEELPLVVPEPLAAPAPTVIGYVPGDNSLNGDEVAIGLAE